MNPVLLLYPISIILFMLIFFFLGRLFLGKDAPITDRFPLFTVASLLFLVFLAINFFFFRPVDETVAQSVFDGAQTRNLDNYYLHVERERKHDSMVACAPNFLIRTRTSPGGNGAYYADCGKRSTGGIAKTVIMAEPRS